jgi:hypothetical protein
MGHALVLERLKRTKTNLVQGKFEGQEVDGRGKTKVFGVSTDVFVQMNGIANFWRLTKCWLII